MAQQNLSSNMTVGDSLVLGTVDGAFSLAKLCRPALILSADGHRSHAQNVTPYPISMTYMYKCAECVFVYVRMSGINLLCVRE